MTLARSKSDEHRLWFEQDSPRFLYAALDFIFQGDYIAGFRVSAIGQGQGMFL